MLSQYYWADLAEVQDFATKWMTTQSSHVAKVKKYEGIDQRGSQRC